MWRPIVAGVTGIEDQAEADRVFARAAGHRLSRWSSWSACCSARAVRRRWRPGPATFPVGCEMSCGPGWAGFRDPRARCSPPRRSSVITPLWTCWKRPPVCRRADAGRGRTGAGHPDRLLTGADAPLTFTHPLVRHAVAQEVTTLRRARVPWPRRSKPPGPPDGDRPARSRALADLALTPARPRRTGGGLLLGAGDLLGAGVFGQIAAGAGARRREDGLVVAVRGEHDNLAHSGGPARIRRVASTPSTWACGGPSGPRRDGAAAANATASAPSRAAPTNSTPGRWRRIMASPSRTMVWSSAMSTRAGHRGPPAGQRHPQPDPVAVRRSEPDPGGRRAAPPRPPCRSARTAAGGALQVARPRRAARSRDRSGRRRRGIHCEAARRPARRGHACGRCSAPPAQSGRGPAGPRRRAGRVAGDDQPALAVDGAAVLVTSAGASSGPGSASPRSVETARRASASPSRASACARATASAGRQSPCLARPAAGRLSSCSTRPVSVCASTSCISRAGRARSRLRRRGLLRLLAGLQLEDQPVGPQPLFLLAAQQRPEQEEERRAAGHHGDEHSGVGASTTRPRSKISTAVAATASGRGTGQAQRRERRDQIQPDHGPSGSA